MDTEAMMEGAAFPDGADGGPGPLVGRAEQESPVSTAATPLEAAGKSSGPLSFRLNGRLIPLLPAGAELELHSRPGGSASGFTTVRDLGPNRGRSARRSPAPPTPVITAVASGEAAERVFRTHSADVPGTGSWAPSAQAAATSPDSSSPAAPAALPPRGNPEPADCPTCRSQYTLIAELRGFMCLCSPALADGLNLLKKQKKRHLRRRRRERCKGWRTVGEPQSRAGRTRPGPSDKKLLAPGHSGDQHTSDSVEPEEPEPPEELEPPGAASQQQPGPVLSPQGKLVIMVEDFYYGSTPQAPPAPQSAPPRPARPYSCIHCPRTLSSNIRLMSHVHEHASNMSPPGQRPTCPHCFRCWASPFLLRRHIEAVHQPAEQPAGTCRICELAFAEQPEFLQHMKLTHRPGEMPYACQVCDFRSSFYSELWSHFEQFHANSGRFLCRYCLKVLQSSACYQHHFSIHQMKVNYSCAKCRLHFLYAKERLEHVRLHHRTHLQPAQLSGIKPGTKVTVRTYSEVRTPEEDQEKGGAGAPCRVVRVDPPSPTADGPPKKLVESLGQLLFTHGPDRPAGPPSPHALRCLECLSSFPDLRRHFPSLVRCSLCRFTTCCSVSYANHMINNHTIGRRRKPHYNSIFQLDPRLSQTLSCTACALTTRSGDVMANHLAEGRGHGCLLRPPSGTPALTRTHLHSSLPADDSPDLCSAGSPPGPPGGSFVPVHLLPSHRSSRLSVRLLRSPLSSSCSPAMTVTFLGPPPQRDGSPRSSFRQKAVCSALLHGVVRASRRYQTAPQTIRSWIQQRQRQRSQTWFWSTEELAQWLLLQREQQLVVAEGTLLQKAREALGEPGSARCYRWVLDFLLRHQLGWDRRAPGSAEQPCGSLPRSILENSRAFIKLLSPQVLRRAPHLVAAMDEIPIFLDPELFERQKASALRLWGGASEPWTFSVVLSALSDGSLLPPLLLFRGAPCCLPEGFPDNVLLEAREEGFSDRACQDLWMDKVWRPHASSRGSSLHLLMVDVHRGHLSAAFRERLGALGTSLLFIPAGCSSCVQPLDVCVTPVLQDFLQTRWNQLVSQGGLDGLGVDQLALTLACWLSEVSSILNSESRFLRRSFSLVSSLQSWERQENVAWMLRDLSRLLLQPAHSLVLPSPRSQVQLVLIVQPEDSKKRTGGEGEEEPGEEEPGERGGGRSPVVCSQGEGL